MGAKGSTLSEQLVGTWKCTHSKNLDAYLKEIAASHKLRECLPDAKSTLIFKLEGDEWTMTFDTPVITHVTKFMLGKEFDDTTFDGRQVKTKFDINGSTLVQYEKGTDGEYDSRTERTVNGNTLTTIYDCNGVKATSVYEKMVEDKKDGSEKTDGADQFIGTWMCTKSENVEAYFTEIDAGHKLTKALPHVKGTLTFEVKGDEWTMKFNSLVSDNTTKFKLGQDFDDTSFDGRQVTSKFELDGNKLVQTEKGGAKNCRKEIIVTGNTLTTVDECNGVKSTCVYEKTDDKSAHKH